MINNPNEHNQLLKYNYLTV